MVQAADTAVREESLAPQSPRGDSGGLSIMGYNWRVCLDADDADLKTLDKLNAIAQDKKGG
jgi:hypothetical protein